MKNKPWEYKKEILSDTAHLTINKTVLEKGKWTVSEINERTKELIEQIIELYPYCSASDDVISKHLISINCDDVYALAYLYEEDGSVEVQEGSELVKYDQTKTEEWLYEIYENLLDEGIIKETENKAVFVKAHMFLPQRTSYTALSAAAGIILCGSRNGWEYWKDENGNAIWVKQYLDESKGVPLSTVWSDIQQVYADPRAYKEGNTADVEVIKEFSGGQKPEALIKRIFEMTTDKGDIVLDFHLGTGTSIAAAHKMGLRYIGVEQLDSQIDIIFKRMQKVIQGETAGISKNVNWQGGGSFVYCELAKLNQKYVDDILSAEDDSEIISIWHEMLKTGFISCKVEPSDIDMGNVVFTELSLDDKKRFLMELLDKNQLYVNYCDMEDESFAVSGEDKVFTKSFYGEM